MTTNSPQDTETEIEHIWTEVLGTDSLTHEDNFFALGGHSLMAVEVRELIEERLGVSLPLPVLFEASTIPELAQEVEKLTGNQQQVKALAMAIRPSDDVASSVPCISPERLMRDLDRLAEFGCRDDGGVDRLAGSDADMAAREWLAGELRELGLDVEIDEVGNVFAVHPNGPQSGLTLCGSHTDTVPAGGTLDGAYGVIAAVEVLRTLNESGHPAAETTALIDFADEEGASPMSPGGFTGSKAFVDSPHLKRVSTYLELHIEQGPRMEQSGHQVSGVAGIVGVHRYRVEVEGEPNHAGTTPMNLRKDAGQAATRMASEFGRLVRSNDGVVGNVGAFTLGSDAPNVVPGSAQFTAEIRGEEHVQLKKCVDEFNNFVTQVADEEGVSASVTPLSQNPPVAFDEDLVQLTHSASEDDQEPLWSYAGHDAGILARHVPTGMIFVPSVDGVSHSPVERTEPEDLARGCQALCDAVVARSAKGGERSA